MTRGASTGSENSLSLGVSKVVQAPDADAAFYLWQTYGPWDFVLTDLFFAEGQVHKMHGSDQGHTRDISAAKNGALPRRPRHPSVSRPGSEQALLS